MNAIVALRFQPRFRMVWGRRARNLVPGLETDSIVRDRQGDLQQTDLRSI
jgi:hypothetical protein